MSNTVQERLRLITLQQNSSASLEQIFGTQAGCERLRKMLANLPRELDTPELAEGRELLDWRPMHTVSDTSRDPFAVRDNQLGERLSDIGVKDRGNVGDTNRYRLVLRDKQLDKCLTEARVESVSIDLTVTKYSADFTQHLQYFERESAGANSTSVSEGLARTCNRAVNHLIGATVMLHVRNQLQERLRVPARLVQHVHEGRHVLHVTATRLGR